jgi:putative SOS response-associated peptidase YedK
MCGRFTLTVDANSIQQAFPWLNLPTQEITPRYNIAPSQPVAVIPNDGKQILDYFNWGLIPSWAKDPKIGYKMINARSETLAEKPSFRSALKHQRCLILADGFYEWAKISGENQKTPHYIYHTDKTPFAFAGLWEEWFSPDGSLIKSTTIITTEPNEKLRSIHNRVPVIVKPEYYNLWLSPEYKQYPELKHIFNPYPGKLISYHIVSKQVNTPAFDSIECIQNI